MFASHVGLQNSVSLKELEKIFRTSLLVYLHSLPMLRTSITWKIFARPLLFSLFFFLMLPYFYLFYVKVFDCSWSWSNIKLVNIMVLYSFSETWQLCFPGQALFLMYAFNFALIELLLIDFKRLQVSSRQHRCQSYI